MDNSTKIHFLCSDYRKTFILSRSIIFRTSAGKFLETFLAFKIPSSENLHEKIEHLTYDATKKTSILRFVETHSHAERSDGVLNFDMTLPSGGQTAIKELLAMVQAVDQTHYDAFT